MSLYVDIEKKLGSFLLRAGFETGNETMALLGASGCGKSVTLKCIAGIITPDCGKIVLDGKTLFDSEAHINLTPQMRNVGYLFQQYALFPNMTVAQNILCGIRTGSRKEKLAKVSEYLRRFRLSGLEKKYPAQLSGGQQQRTALARILASEPQTILLDEPFAALDSFLKWQLELELHELLSDFSGPILWVSHDLGECCRNCRSVCVIENGKTGEVTDMDTLIRHPSGRATAQLAGYRNLLPASCSEAGVLLDGWNIALPLTFSAPRCTVAIPDGAVTPGIGTNTAKVLRVIHDVSSDVLLLGPADAHTAPPLRAIKPEGTSFAEGQIIPFALTTELCLCCREEE